MDNRKIDTLLKNANLGEAHFKKWFLFLSDEEKEQAFIEVNNVVKEISEFWNKLPEEVKIAIQYYTEQQKRE